MKFKELLKAAYKKRRPIDYIFFVAIIAAGIGIDQLTKWLAATYLVRGGTTPLWQGVLHLTYVENTGAAFGMLKNAPWVFNSVSVIAILAMSLYLFLGHAEGKLYQVSIAMIISGGIGNMIDRISLGYVVDFIDFCAFPELWMWVFNMADAFVCVGGAMLVLWLIISMVKDYKAEKAAKLESTDVAADSADSAENTEDK